MSSGEWHLVCPPKLSAAWRGELRLCARILGNAPRFIDAVLGDSTYADMAMANASQSPRSLAIESSVCSWTWEDLAWYITRFAAELSDAGVLSGQIVPVFGENSAHTVASILALQWLGAVPLPVDTLADLSALANDLPEHEAALCVLSRSAPKGWRESIRGSTRTIVELSPEAGILHGASVKSRVAMPRRAIAAKDCAWLPTSGTTTFPKISRVSQSRARIAATGFAHLVYEFVEGDKLITSMSICHATGLLLALGPALARRIPLVLLSSFSASGFLKQAEVANATVWLGVGEMVRWLLRQPESIPADQQHNLRLMVGMGFEGRLLANFRARFGISRTTEFYGASDGPIALIGISAPDGVIGRVPTFLRWHLVLARYDQESEDLAVDELGYGAVAAVDEVGELLVRQPLLPKMALGSFEGYANEASNDCKIRRSVFRPGDCFYRSFDLMRRDRYGFLHFVGRVGDLIRFKGKNIVAENVESAMFLKGVVADLVAYGVRVEGIDGFPPVLAVVWESEPRLDLFTEQARTLSAGEIPRFVRSVTGIERTATHRPRRALLQQEGVDPATVKQPLHVLVNGRYSPLDEDLYAALSAGEVRL